MSNVEKLYGVCIRHLNTNKVQSQAFFQSESLAQRKLIELRREVDNRWYKVHLLESYVCIKPTDTHFNDKKTGVKWDILKYDFPQVSLKNKQTGEMKIIYVNGYELYT